MSQQRPEKRGSDLTTNKAAIDSHLSGNNNNNNDNNSDEHRVRELFQQIKKPFAIGLGLGCAGFGFLFGLSRSGIIWFLYEIAIHS